jgi:uncharacterized protein (UPF0332 family)
MSPRSEEFLESADGRLRAARVTLEAGESSVSLSASYYAMLFAARAALSELDRYAKTHTGTWELFRESFVFPGRFDPALARAGQRAQALRWSSDYDALVVAPEDAAQWLQTAERFVAAVRAMLD